MVELLTVLPPNAVNVMNFVPVLERPAVIALTSTYDATSVIQQAVDYAVTIGCKCLVFPAGRLIVTGTVTLTGGGWTVRGEGPSCIVRKTTDGDVFRVDLSSSNSHVCLWENFRIEAVVVGDKSNTNGIHYYTDDPRVAGTATYHTFSKLSFSGVYRAFLFDKPAMTLWNGLPTIADYGHIKILDCSSDYATGSIPYVFCEFAGGPGAHNEFRGGTWAATEACLKMGDGDVNTGLGDQIIDAIHLINADYGIWIVGPAIPTTKTTWTGTVDTNGTAVTRVSGDPFTRGAFTSLTINGVSYNCTVTDADNLVIGSSAGTQTGVSFSYDTFVYRYNENVQIGDNQYDGIRVATVRMERMKNFRIQPHNSTSGAGLQLVNCWGYEVHTRNVARSTVRVPFYSGQAKGANRYLMALTPSLLGQGTLNLVGDAVTWVSGDKFQAGITTINIAGTQRTVSAVVDDDHLTLSTSPGDVSGATFYYTPSLGLNHSALVELEAEVLVSGVGARHIRATFSVQWGGNGWNTPEKLSDTAPADSGLSAAVAVGVPSALLAGISVTSSVAAFVIQGGTVTVTGDYITPFQINGSDL